MRLAYHCKFCQKPGEVIYKDEGLLTEERVTYWLKFVACNSCAEYHRSRSDLTHAIFQTASNWNVIQKSGEVPSVVQQKARNKIQVLLMRLCSVVEKFKHIGGIYKSQMSDDLLQTPEDAGKVIGRILRK